jgi:hypothetical protein
VSNPKFEPERCNMLRELFKIQNIDECFIKYISPTYKHTITKEIYYNNIKEQQVLRLRNTPMRLGELSLFLNYKANLEYIAKNYKDGMFLVFESDILLGKDINNLNEFLTSIKDKDWDLIHIGMYHNGIWLGHEHSWFPTGYIERVERIYNKDARVEDITSIDDKFRLSRKFNTRCTDSFLWKYNSIIKYLNWMNNVEPNFGVPMDYYMCNFFEKNLDFKHYWSNDEFFKQASNLGIMPSTVQR